MEIENLNPSVFKKLEERDVTCGDEDDDVVDPFDTREIFGNFNILTIIRTSIVVIVLNSIYPSTY